jgi:hypothetical protein
MPLEGDWQQPGLARSVTRPILRVTQQPIAAGGVLNNKLNHLTKRKETKP